MRLVISAVLTLSLLICLAGCQEPEKADTTQVVVIPKGTSHDFWQAVKAGAEKAGKEFGVEVIWKGPVEENDRAGQIQIVDQFIAQGVDGIVLAPLDAQALARPVRSAGKADIPVVIFDSALAGEVGKDFVSFVATDNYQGGKLAGEKMVELLGGKGKVVLLRYQANSASTDKREQGFVDVIQQAGGMELIVDNQYGGTSIESARSKATQLLDQLRVADGVYCPNESTTNGMLQALKQADLAGKIKFVGFDSSKALIAGLSVGQIDALVVQNPRKMGYQAVKAMAETLKGQEVQGHYDTGVVVVTPANMSEPDVAKVLQ